MTYRRARSGFEALERVAELSDQVELDAMRLQLMENPTKAMAAKMYRFGITLWFQQHGNRYAKDKSVRKIARRISKEGKS